jgi:transketolase
MVGVAKGAYIVASDPTPDVILIATGSEVSVALAAREILSQEGISSRVISMPCTEWFDRQPPEYQESILPRHISARVAVEAGATFGWYKYVGTNGVVVGIDKFGASASAPALFELYNITPEAVAIASRQSIKNSSDK